MTGVDTSLVVTHVISGDLWAGAEVQVYNLCRALHSSATVKPTAVVFNKGILHNKLKELGIPITLADEKKHGPIAIARSIAAHCRAHASTVVHTHGFKENIVGIMGKEMARVPLSIRTVHGNPETKPSATQPHKWLISRLDYWLGRFRQQAVVAVSSQLEETLNRIFPGKVYKIFNFVDVEEIRKQWPVVKRAANSAPRIGIVGRLVPVKRIDLFVRTIALLNQQGLACTGVIIGSGPLENDLRHLAADLKMNSAIEFKGFVNPSLDELRKLDALLMTSDHEGLPMTLIEALSIQIPIVAHKVGGIPEVLSDGRCGWLVADHSEKAYSMSVKRLFSSSTETNEKIEAGLEHVRRYFGATANTDQYLKLYCTKYAQLKFYARSLRKQG